MKAIPDHDACPYPALPPPVDVHLTALPAQDCPYLPGRPSRSRAFLAGRLPPDLYHDFLDAGFRRSGKVIYQPTCRGCRQCLSLRVLVDRFQPNKSQRRCARGNADLVIEQGAPVATDEKFALYRRYVTQWHGKLPGDDSAGSANDREAFESFLYDSPVDTIEFTYRDRAGRLLAVGLCDRARLSLSSVYFYFDPPDAHRGLGTFGAIHELSVARAMNIPFYYLGFWVRGCSAMSYKANFRPHQVLLPDGRWCDDAMDCDILSTGDETVVDAR